MTILASFYAIVLLTRTLIIPITTKCSKLCENYFNKKFITVVKI